MGVHVVNGDGNDNHGAAVNAAPAMRKSRNAEQFSNSSSQSLGVECDVQ